MDSYDGDHLRRELAGQPLFLIGSRPFQARVVHPAWTRNIFSVFLSNFPHTPIMTEIYI